MAPTTSPGLATEASASTSALRPSAPRTGSTWHRAYVLLRATFAALPIVTGVDKLFFDRLTDWSIYVAPVVVKHSPISVDALMRVAGICEIAAGLLVAFLPRIGAKVVVLWLIGIVTNLLLTGHYGDIVVRDIGLAAAALALDSLSAAPSGSSAHPRYRPSRTRRQWSGT
jgi:hypothetical protein